MIEILNSSIIKTGDFSWKVKSGNLKIEYTFSEKDGISASSMSNSAGNHEVEYLSETNSITPVPTAEGWSFVSDAISEEKYGGQDVLVLKVRFNTVGMLLTLNVIAFPGVSVIRQYFEIKNIGLADREWHTFKPFEMKVHLEEPGRDIYRIDYMRGGEPSYEHGMMESQVLGRNWYTREVCFNAEATNRYMPLAILKHDDGAEEGLMIQMDYLGPWEFRAKRSHYMKEVEAYVDLAFTIDNKVPISIEPQETFKAPSFTFAAYAGDRDNLMKELYDWQYKYHWDYVNDDYFAKTRGQGANWIYCTRNLHEQFAYRLVAMDLAGAEKCKRVGYDILWNDAGWSAYPSEWPEDSYRSVFKNNYEGPDYRISNCYFKRCGMKWLLWFAGKPSEGVLANKEGAWGEFEWRTDGLSCENYEADKDFRNMVKGYLDGNKRRSYHTCSCGSTYSHTFDITRYANYNFITDAGAGPYGNYYFSFFEPADKWGDLTAIQGAVRTCTDGSTYNMPELINPEDLVYVSEYSRAKLSLVPIPCALDLEENIPPARRDLAIYKYMLSQGVAGYGSYMYHPEIYGDKEYYYMQRVSNDHLRSVLIFRHTPPKKKIYIFPRGLKENELYSVTFQNSDEKFERDGKSLMQDGIALDNVSDGELIYFNLDNHPGSKNEHEPPAIENVVCRYEVNVGASGTAIYWNPLPEDERIEYYEILRNGEKIAESAVGTYWFDYKVTYDESAVYSVCAVNIFGIKGKETKATRITGDVICCNALGNHGEGMERFGWSAECSNDLKTFTPMHWVAPENVPFADYWGTPNQQGGSEGYFEGADSARVGRGWMQASPTVYTCRKLKVSSDGKVRISGRAMKEWYHKNAGKDVSATIMLNERTLFSEEVECRNLYGAAHDIITDVASGDEIRFILGKTDAKNNVMPYEKEADIIGWIPTVTYLNEAKEGFFSRETINGSQYNANVPIGIYDIRLRVAKTDSAFDVKINNATFVKSVDITRRQSNEIVCNNVVADKDGKLNISLTNGAIIEEVIVADVKRSHIRINCGGEKFVDWAGGVWEADNEVGITSDKNIIQASPTLYDQGIYRTAREAMGMTYKLPVSAGLYSVHLKFAELWSDGVARVADIHINDKLVKGRFDAEKSAGYADMAFDLRFDNIAPIDGIIKVEIKARGEKPAILQAIECE